MNDEVLEAYGKKELDDVSYWVYVLDCRPRFFCEEYAELERRAENRLGYNPDWLRMAWEANRTKYVGQTENLEKRLGQHFQNKNSSDFTTLFEPVGVDFLKTARSRNQAEYSEAQIAKSYYDNDDVFSYYK